ncbi:pilus assembly protein TadG-related protein [Massilia solisilvae]|uniref:Pilus assembly protein TadG-related protein n=1 Tax=Massilia solisilvae TaxID=1811225 RepID=A0ABT2BDR3_9BURK|nr:pilus assembly protein TadG-related protein [Massilia solisilvae]MCS0606671.1 pilus assembly protein TadG-related protein [Massilia solisilvae]
MLRPLGHTPRREAGQALIFGLFGLIGGLVALFFLFNTGQLTAEKTKLVNTADAVAYSAGVMHARALNFDAYTNRALIANEVMIAQAVSMASWATYVADHSNSAQSQMNCTNQYSVPVRLGLLTYAPVCYSLAFSASIADGSGTSVSSAGQTAVAAAEQAKNVLQAAQVNMAADLFLARKSLMQEVADANYVNEGAVHVDNIPLTDDFGLNGSNFITRYADNDRTRFKDATVEAANRDRFVPKRSWDSANGLPCITDSKAEFRRRGGTELIGLDEWRAMDTASVHTWSFNVHLFSFSCDEDETPLGAASQGAGASSGRDNGFGGSRSDNPVASGYASSKDWNYSGLPKFYDLKQDLLKASDDLPPPLRFAVRLTRSKDQTRTSEGRSAVKPSGRLAKFDSKLASDVLMAVSTSEVFFRRPSSRSDGKTELASLFNPFWQVHLVSTSSADIAKAIALGEPR